MRVQQLRGHQVQELSRIAVAWAVPALEAHVREGLKGSGESARRCREFIIKMAQGYDALGDMAKQSEIQEAPDILAGIKMFCDHHARRVLKEDDPLDDDE